MKSEWRVMDLFMIFLRDREGRVNSVFEGKCRRKIELFFYSILLVIG